jgi:hypothetical protein
MSTAWCDVVCWASISASVGVLLRLFPLLQCGAVNVTHAGVTAAFTAFVGGGWLGFFGDGGLLHDGCS